MKKDWTCPCRGKQIEEWRKPENLGEVRAALEARVAVHDPDHDCIFGVVSSSSDTSETGTFDVVGYEGLSYDVGRLWVEDVPILKPATPEEEDEAVASILQAFTHNN